MSNEGLHGVGPLLRELGPQVLGAVARRHGDFAAAEDAVQDALIAAAQRWPDEGLPDNPRGWLFHVASRRMVDRIRSETTRRSREEEYGGTVWAESAFVPPADEDPAVEEDDPLLLLFMCCHPSLTPASAIALTLRAVGGLTTAEIARAFMVREATMAQRISRAKRAIRESGIPFELPDEEGWAARLRAVLHVVYLMFNEGYVTSAGPDLYRAELSAEAIRLTRAAAGARPDDPDVLGLLALMLLTDARRDARVGRKGELIPLDEQDRTLWDRTLIEEGVSLVERSLSLGPAGPYSIQAAIAALHDEAPSADATDWAQILALYERLTAVEDNPMAALGHAAAFAMVHGPTAGLERLDELEADPELAGHYRLDAVRGHLLARAGDTERAIEHFHAAARATASLAERDYLLLEASRLLRS